MLNITTLAYMLVAIHDKQLHKVFSILYATRAVCGPDKLFLCTLLIVGKQHFLKGVHQNCHISGWLQHNLEILD